MTLTVRDLIEMAGGSAHKLGSRLGVARTTVLDWRRVNLIPGSRIAQISVALDIPPAELLPIVQGPRVVKAGRGRKKRQRRAQWGESSHDLDHPPFGGGSFYA